MKRSLKCSLAAALFLTLLLAAFTTIARADEASDMPSLEDAGFVQVEGGPSAGEAEPEELEDDVPGMEQFGRAGMGEGDEALLDDLLMEGEVEPMRYDAISSLKPMALSSEMIYFIKYESAGNYDAGLSFYDGYHAMGAFQLDNRYGLGEFLKLAYQYNTKTYSALKVIGDRYGWDTNRATRSGNAFTQFGNDLNAAWHAAYKANPKEFSQLQNAYAYETYYNSGTGARKGLKAFGIDIDSKPDCIKGLVWGMYNLFGPGGGEAYIKNRKYSGANWFIKGSGVNNSMSDVQFVTTLCNYVVNNVSTRYRSQPEYFDGWMSRYRSELADCLAFLAKSSKAEEPIYRLYNRKTSEHLYTRNFGEYCDLPIITNGDWVQEGVAWWAPKTGKTPVYRLYNKTSGDHHYTTNPGERDDLVGKHGWTLEGTAFHSDDKKGVPLYRLYNGNLKRGQHHYTASVQERDDLTSSYGWRDEGVGFYGVK